jgi:hypothetical protein
MPWQERDDLFRYLNESSLSPETEPILLVGGILFNNGRDLAVIGQTRTGNLRCGFVNLQEKQFAVNFSPGRLLDIGDQYGKIDIVHLEVGGIDTITTDSIRQTHEPVHALLYARRLPTGEQTVIPLEQDQLLDLMTGTKGGITIFYGDTLPEENALVVETKPKEAVIAFIHPEKSVGQGLNSVRGVFEFFNKLNNEFLRDCHYPLVRQAVDRLQALVKAGVIVDSPARLAIFESLIIGNAFQAAAIGDERYWRFLQRHLGDLTKKIITRLPQSPNAALQGIMMTSKRAKEIPETPAQVELVDKQEFPDSPLKTENARLIYKKAATALQRSQALSDGKRIGYLSENDHDSSDDSCKIQGYVFDIISFLIDANNTEQLDDCAGLLAYLIKTDYFKRNPYFDIRYEIPKGLAMWILEREHCSCVSCKNSHIGIRHLIKHLDHLRKWRVKRFPSGQRG